MILQPGWLERQFKRVDDDIATWPEWMRREAGFMEFKRSIMDSPAHMSSALLIPIPLSGYISTCSWWNLAMTLTVALCRVSAGTLTVKNLRDYRIYKA